MPPLLCFNTRMYEFQVHALLYMFNDPKMMSTTFTSLFIFFMLLHVSRVLITCPQNRATEHRRHKLLVNRGKDNLIIPCCCVLVLHQNKRSIKDAFELSLFHREKNEPKKGTNQNVHRRFLFAVCFDSKQ